MPADRPNVLLIVSHDTGRHLGCYGRGHAQSPHIDALAEGGCRFDSHFACATVCSPSRGALLTGRYPQTNGMMGLSHSGWGWSLNEGERHLSHLMRDAGYRTVLIGHQHETEDIDRDLAFDEHGLHRDEDTGEHLPCEVVADGAAEFLRDFAEDSQPFYLQVGFFETHKPYGFGGATPVRAEAAQVPRWMQDNQAIREEMAALQGNLKKMDKAVGTIVRALQRAGLHEQTLVIYTTDHGLDLPRAKATCYDPGMETAMIMRLPGVSTPGSVCEHLSSHIDLVPTVLDLCGIEPPDNLQGLSLAPALDGEAPGREHAFAMMTQHGRSSEHRAVRSDRYKLIRNFAPGRNLAVPVDLSKQAIAGDRPLVELYDLGEDPLESENLADAPHDAEAGEALDAELWGWMRQTGDPLLAGPVATPFYRRAMAERPET